MPAARRLPRLAAPCAFDVGVLIGFTSWMKHSSVLRASIVNVTWTSNASHVRLNNEAGLGHVPVVQRLEVAVRPAPGKQHENREDQGLPLVEVHEEASATTTRSQDFRVQQCLNDSALSRQCHTGAMVT